MLEERVLERLQSVEERFLDLEEQMGTPEVASDSRKLQETARNHAELRDVVEAFREWKQLESQWREAQEMTGDEDAEMAEMAQAEMEELQPRLEECEGRLHLLLLPKDPLGERNIIVEIRAGTGGDEAALFAGDLAKMYALYAEGKNWQTEIVENHPGELGGYKEIVFRVIGKNAYNRLRYEGGTHRVQRVPVTESQGRIHTSAATVAVLPEAEEVDVEIEEKDLRVDTYCASGPGGQGVNTTYSAVRITHLPTGIVAQCQDERSQIKNRASAMRVLRSRLLEARMAEEEARQTASRRQMVGTGDRSQKIRTYNFPESRITDHRINYKTNRLVETLQGDLDPLIDSLIEDEQSRMLAEGVLIEQPE